MATIQGEVVGIFLEAEALANVSGSHEFAWAYVAFEMPAYTASSDDGKLGGGGKDRGATTTDTLATMIQKQRRDGKTVTLKSAMLARPGRQSATRFYTGALTVNTGNLTFNITQVDESTEIDAASGVRDEPIGILVRYKLA
jgi:hypothetical protein